jgi:hypothetical protein
MIKTAEKKDKKSFGTYAFLTSKYFDFNLLLKKDPKDFKGYTFLVKSIDGHSLDQYRTDPLTEREQNTYKTIDSLKNIKSTAKPRSFQGCLTGRSGWVLWILP